MHFGYMNPGLVGVISACEFGFALVVAQSGKRKSPSSNSVSPSIGSSSLTPKKLLIPALIPPPRPALRKAVDIPEEVSKLTLPIESA